MLFERKLFLSLLYLIISLASLKLFASIHPEFETTMINKFYKIAADYEKSLFDYSPELGLFWGKSDVAQDRFTDYSIEATEKWQQQEDHFLNALSQLDEAALKKTPVYSTYLLLKETLENKKASRICKEELWDVNPAWGWHVKMAIVAEKQPIGTIENRRLALKRWQTFDRVVDDQITNLKKGLALRYSAPKPAIERVLAQLKIMLNSGVEESPFFNFAKQDNNPVFKQEIASIIGTVINPSLIKYINYLENEYLPLARKVLGVSALPAGAQCYQAKIKQETTLSKSPEEIHQLGLQYIQKLSQEIGDIGLKQYGTSDITHVFQQAQLDPENYFSSEKELLDYNFAALERAKSKLANWFDTVPKTEGTIKPYPEYRAKTGASGEYHPPSEDGTEPGIFYINTFEPQKRNRIDQEATLFHELIPGHHFQIALTYENKSLPSLNKYLWNSGYGEGWALYVERLADEMGLYQDDISRLGMLSNEILRAARLVVDTGLHTMGWSREKAIQFLVDHTSLSKNIIEAEVDRYIMLPGQATAYMLGKAEIEDLRALAKKQLKDRFDIREFHNQVLQNGSLSLPVLRVVIENWLREYDRQHPGN
ncbi:conserved protein of unknown function [Legionella micdadei]|uniref:Uncharacterized conserved protein, DUF885 familyt n=2 Tax=Legionella micdadei TaxID=451 RepID=A0A098GGG3_LEGMI|nr:secreted protein [Legionella micdadei]CEG61579.1 conserved protein of unknown function [Legionella micdadei]SCY46393.1 Uncharacterized conserved protein, DUF885 familyt [Legionella micdadei]